MRLVKAGRVNLGLLMIILGVAAFAVNLDAMHWTVYLQLLRLWPVILIAIGLQMVLRRVYAPLAYVSCLFVTVAGFWVLYDNYALYGIEGENRLSSLPVSRLDESITHVAVDVSVDHTDLSVSGSSTELMRCYYDEPFGRPKVRYETDGDVAKVFVEHGGFSGLTFFDEYEISPDWSVKLYEGMPMTLKLACNDSDLRLRLSELMVEKLVCDTRYSMLDVRFGSLVPDVTASLRAGRSEVRIMLPDGAGIEILDAGDFDDFYEGDIQFLGDSDTLRTMDFDSTPLKFRFDLDGKPTVLRIAYY